MNKIKYGVPEIIASFIGTFAFVFIEMAEKSAVISGIIGSEIYNWVQLRVLVLSLVAVLFGPIAGTVCGLGGGMLINVLLESAISYPEVICLGVFGIALGSMYDKLGVRAGRFGFREYVDFNAISIMTGIGAGVMVMPLMSLVLDGSNLYYKITIGVKSVVGNSVVNAVVCGIILAVVSSVARKCNETRMQTKRDYRR